MKIEKVSITREDIETLLTMEGGGFDYWCHIDFDKDAYRNCKKRMTEREIKPEYEDGYCYEEIVSYMIEWGYDVYAYDFEEDTRYRLTPAILTEGFRLNAQNRPEDASLDNGDAITGDCILQYAVFGDVIYS